MPLVTIEEVESFKQRILIENFDRSQYREKMDLLNSLFDKMMQDGWEKSKSKSLFTFKKGEAVIEINGSLVLPPTVKLKFQAIEIKRSIESSLGIVEKLAIIIDYANELLSLLENEEELSIIKRWHLAKKRLDKIISSSYELLNAVEALELVENGLMKAKKSIAEAKKR